ncbi:MAG: fasciclin domain-containing protein [Acidimicrobiales bacterium]
MRKLTAAAALAASALAASTLPAASQELPGAVDVVIEVSGDSGFDRNGRDYDMLRDALLVTGLADAVAAAEDVTIFAPTDAAFKRLARDLGWAGFGESSAFAFLASVTGFESADEAGLLDDILLYHVAPGARSVADLSESTGVATLLDGASLSFGHNSVIDADTNDRNARFIAPNDLDTSNGTVHTVNQVLRPLDLDAADGTVDLVLEASGSSGFDRNPRDYDMLRDALVATGLVDAVAAADDVTVFAPTDGAFKRLARDLGWEGRGERSAFNFLVEATGFESADEPGILADVLLYHVAPEAQTVRQLRGERGIDTLLEGSTLAVRNNRAIVDGDRNDANARLRAPSNVGTSNGIVHTINQVLRPIDL